MAEIRIAYVRYKSVIFMILHSELKQMDGAAVAYLKVLAQHST